MNIRLSLLLVVGAISFLTAQDSISTIVDAKNPTNHTIYAKRTFVNHFFGSNHSVLDFDDYTGGFELKYARSLNDKLDFAIPFRVNVIHLPEELKNRRNISFDGLLELHYDKKATIDPYLVAGAGFAAEPNGISDIQVPLGLGFNIRLNRVLYLNLQSEYRFSFSGNRKNYVHGLGLGLNLNELIQPVAPPVLIEVADRDKDGVLDEEDECPDMAGKRELNGCPDSDGDGIGDQVDACPDLAGPPEHKGCPDSDGDGLFDLVDDCPDVAGVRSFNGCPDSDGDGIQDSKDDCPNEKGIRALNGCPEKIKDSDGDGVADEIDRCPQLAGPANAKGCPDSDDDGLDDSQDRCPNKPGPLSNSGCPEISMEDKATLEFAVQAVNFETGSAALTAPSLPVLAKLVDILKRYPEYQLFISGHTDSVGEEEKNRVLSQSRADACKNYLVSQGVSASRMSAMGYGQTQPKASNETLEGRLLNRRVEFALRLK